MWICSILLSTASAGFVYRVKEALILLNLKSGNIILLRNILKEALHSMVPPDKKHKMTDPVATLQEFKVYKLSLEQAEFILTLRADVG